MQALIHALHALGMDEFRLDETQSYHCIFAVSGEELMLTLNVEEQSHTVFLSVTTSASMKHECDKAFFMAFSRQAMEPFRGGVGVGVFPESEEISVYNAFSYIENDSDEILALISNVVEKAYEWQMRLIEPAS
ncbi:CesT family type III secretion system chaperone [uncultured Shewanella sp.]|uniref:CesT family type III secretion system chaperone n=1 Tax=uncultured Shewanella sp. TaxID=173975 RepID=UPI00261B743B|nr:CesT family type III secretion system chaperone [uncultured Shewanella sp.]